MFLNRLILSQGWRSLTSILNPVTCFKFLFGESHCQSKDFVTLVTWYFLHVNMLEGLWLGCCRGVWKIIYFLLNLDEYVTWTWKSSCQKKRKEKPNENPRLLSCLLAMVKTNGDTKRCVGVGRGQLLFLKSNRGRRTHAIASQWQLSLSNLKP